MELGYSSNIENKINLSHKKIQFYERLQYSIPKVMQSIINSVEETIKYIEEHEDCLKSIAKQNQVEAFKRYLNFMLKKQKSSIPQNYQYPEETFNNGENDFDNGTFFSQLNDIERRAAEYFVKLCESDYLKESNENLKDLLWKYVDIRIPLNKIDEIIKKINIGYKPIGTCTRNLKEYWLVYLHYTYYITLPDKIVLVQKAKDLITNYFNEFIEFKWYKIIKNLNISKVEFLNIYELIKGIPQKNISQNTNVIAPYFDFSAIITNNKVTVNYIGYSFDDNESSNISNEMDRDYSIDTDCYIINQYEKLEKNGELTPKDKNVLKGLRNKIKKINDAQNDTSLHIEIRTKIIEKIVEFQKEIFITGDCSKLKPMILDDIAKLTGYHISTITRFVSINMIETQFGNCLLKNLFSASAGNVASISLKYILILIQEAILSENKNKPISDAEIRKFLLNKYSININLRTIANHREKKLNIRNANIRRVIYEFNLDQKLINKRELAIFQ